MQYLQYFCCCNWDPVDTITLFCFMYDMFWHIHKTLITSSSSILLKCCDIKFNPLKPPSWDLTRVDLFDKSVSMQLIRNNKRLNRFAIVVQSKSVTQNSFITNGTHFCVNNSMGQSGGLWVPHIIICQNHQTKG